MSRYHLTSTPLPMMEINTGAKVRQDSLTGWFAVPLPSDVQRAAAHCERRHSPSVCSCLVIIRLVQVVRTFPLCTQQASSKPTVAMALPSPKCTIGTENKIPCTLFLIYIGGCILHTVHLPYIQTFLINFSSSGTLINDRNLGAAPLHCHDFGSRRSRN